ncbi:MAG: hypothetical protein HYR94_06115, partial [Chloroflexi bacterium]|nr:hypothetical protein [Chloroflexota bacterium]
MTDGPDDKKVDICHIDLNEGRAVISQGYFSQKWGKPSAKSDKASDLNTAVSWLLSASEDRIPPHLKSKALELRRTIQEGQIQRLELVFIHNCYESPNVKDELKAAANAANEILRSKS